MDHAASIPSRSTDAQVIATVGFAHATSHFFHLVLPPLFPWLMPAFGLSYTQAGALMTVFFVVSGIGQALAGFVVDRWGALRVLYGGVGLLAMSALVLAGAGGVAGLTMAAAIAGLGNSVFHPADYGILNRKVSGSRMGHAFSVHGLSGNFGWAAAPLLMTTVAGAAGWRWAAAAAAAAGFAALMLLWSRRGLLADDASAAPSPAAAGAGTFRFLATPVVWLAFAFFVLATMGFGALQNFAPPLLGALYGLTLAVATSALTAYLLGGSVGLAVGGFLAGSGRSHERMIAVALLIGVAAALLVAARVPPAWSIVAVMAAMGFGVGLAGPSRDMLIRRATAATFGPQAYGRVYGFVYSGLDAGLAIAPLVFGRLMDAGRPAAVMVGVAAAFGCAAAVALAVGAQARAVELRRAAGA